MGGLTPAQCNWVIAPLLAAGLALDEVRDHLFRLAFDGIVSDGTVGVGHLVGDQPTHLRGAWVEVVDRMIRVHATAG